MKQFRAKSIPVLGTPTVSHDRVVFDMTVRNKNGTDMRVVFDLDSGEIRWMHAHIRDVFKNHIKEMKARVDNLNGDLTQ